MQIVTFGILLGVLGLIAALMYRSRLRRMRQVESAVVTDDTVRQIEEHGWVDVDEPLDLTAIQEEEARFWEEEPWEEADEW